MTTLLVRAAIVDAPTTVLALSSAILLLRFRLQATWPLLGGAALGWVVHALGLAAA